LSQISASRGTGLRDASVFHFPVVPR
jgi:hypothetical protein